jgi:dihydroorotate dehydrogenase electron transfer subunit
LQATQGKEYSANDPLGGRKLEDISLVKEFKPFGEVMITTEDGSGGVKGMVTDHPVLTGSRFSFDRVYSCGPEPMMKAIAQVAGKLGTFCEVSLENTMACGFGACLCCVTATTTGNKCVCTEGPVFNAADLLWQT